MYIYYQGNDGCIKTIGDNELAHYNHNHDAFGRFAGRSGGVSKSAKANKRLQKKIMNSERAFVSEYANTAASERMKLSNIRRSDADVNEIALNKVVNRNINKSNKNVKKYLDKYYNKGFDSNNEKDRIKMGEYYAEIRIAQLNIERANQMNEANGRGRLAESFRVTDPLDTRTAIPQGYSYKTTRDIKREQKRRKNK